MMQINVYYKSGAIICLYVDELLIFGSNFQCVEETKKFLSSNFGMKDVGETDVIVGINIVRIVYVLSLTQSHYIEKMIKKYDHED
jgi:hypothetical protein